MDFAECKKCGGLVDKGEYACPACGLVQGSLQVVHNKEISLSIGMVVRTSPKQERISCLSKEATQLRKDGDLDRAIERLMKVQSLMLDEPYYTVEAWLRLPKYLQLAGRFNEAIAEFDKVVRYANNNILTPIPENSLRYSEIANQEVMHRNLVIIYRGKLLVCKREKRLELMDDCEEKIRYHDSEWARLKPLVEQEVNDRLEKSKARRDTLKNSKKG